MILPSKNKELVFSLTKKDFRVDTFRAGGPGGSNQNKSNTGVRITHIESGASAEGRDSRSYEENKKNAFRRMYESKKFQDWLRIKMAFSIPETTSDEIIRTYNFHRKEVKDMITGEKYNLKKFMNGDYAA